MSERIGDHREGVKMFRTENSVRELMGNPERIRSVADTIRHRDRVVDFIMFGGTNADQRHRLFGYIHTIRPWVQEYRKREI